MTTFTCISDTHQKHDQIKVPEADIVFCSGDINAGNLSELKKFLDWFSNLPHKHKVFIAGNHDWVFQKNEQKAKELCEKYEDNGVIYLQDSGCKINGIKIWGSPQTPEFCDWAFNCWRTLQEERENERYKWIGHYWRLIPDDTDILITHGPPRDVLDYCYGENVGCDELRKRIVEIEPKFHIFGHIHEGRGHSFHWFQDRDFAEIDTFFINASSLDGRYTPYPNKATVFDYEKQTIIRE